MRRLLRVAILGWASLAEAQDLVAGKPVSMQGGTHVKGDNPSGLMPDHQAVPFGPGARDGKIEIAQVAAWEKALAAEAEVQRWCVTDPIATLRRLLRSKGQPSLTQLMPIVGCVDASAYFTLQVRRVRFSGGEGFLFVTERTQEPVLASNDGLTAMFQGLSTDGTTWVGGSFPVRAKGLRDRADGLVDDDLALEKAIAADAAMPSKLRSSDFEPSLDALATAIAKLELPAICGGK